MTRFLTLTAVALLIGAAPALAVEESAKVPSQSRHYAGVVTIGKSVASEQPKSAPGQSAVQSGPTSYSAGHDA